MMKKIYLVILALLVAFCLAACGSYTPPTGGGRPSSGGGDGGEGGNGGGGTDDPVDEPSVFTVTLVNAPDDLPEDMQAIWTGKSEVHTAYFVNGVATAEGLDGDYHVTLSTLPKGYTYDCNGYTADNDEKNIQIELLEILSYRQYVRLTPNNEEEELRWYTISKYGTYRITLNSSSDSVAFMFEPSENGRFSITSWCDVTANEINPILKIYYGHRSYCQFIEEVDGGGSGSTFAKNFRYEAEFGDENVGAVQPFAIKANVRGIDYPVTVDFTIKREAEYQLPSTEGEPVYATGPFYTGPAPTGTWRYIYEDNFSVSGGNTYYVQDQDKVVFNPNDGYYHVGTVDGPLLYARLIKDSQVFVTEYMESWINKGFTWNELAGGLVSLNIGGYNYSYMINQGYANYCTTDECGAHPVTKELQQFLQAYASNQNLFKDGEGWAEDPGLNANDNVGIPDGIRLQSDENSMWLFACGYYR